MSLYQETGLNKQERKSGSRLRDAFETARVRNKVRRGPPELLESRNGIYLYAVNSRSRIKWGKALCDQIEAHFDLSPKRPYPQQPLFFVTLVHVKCSTPHDAKIDNVKGFIKQLRVGLNGLSYIGMIEPAYYVNICEGARYKGKRGVFWHIHAICWGETADEMKVRFKELKRRQDNYRPIADGFLGAHYKRIPKTYLADKSRTHLADKIRYMLKFPRKAYRIYPTGTVTSDGEIIPRFKQKQDDLRPGEYLTIFHLLKDLYLDQMALAGGEGVGILRQAKQVSLRKFRKSEGR